MSMKWAIPIRSMKESQRHTQKQERDEEEYERVHKLKYCPECERVYKKSDFMFKKDRKLEEEHYHKGSMPSYGLDKKVCLGCTK